MKKNNSILFGKDVETTILPSYEKDYFYNILYNDLKKYPPLSRDEELELLNRYKETKDIDEKYKIRDKLVLHNMRSVVAISKQCYDTRFQFMDILGEGVYGLIQSIDKYDPSKGVRLYTFASHYILKYIKQFKHDNNGIVNYSFSRYRTIYRMFVKYIYNDYYKNIEQSKSKVYENPLCSILNHYDSVFEEFKNINPNLDVLSYKYIIYKEICSTCISDNTWQHYIPSENIINATMNIYNAQINIIEDNRDSRDSKDNNDNDTIILNDNLLHDGYSDVSFTISETSIGKNIDYVETIRIILFRKIWRMYHHCSAIFIFYKYKMSIRYLSFMKSRHIPDDIKSILKKIHDAMLETNNNELESLYLDAIPYLYKHIRKGCDAKKAMKVIEELKDNPVIVQLLKTSIYAL